MGRASKKLLNVAVSGGAIVDPTAYAYVATRTGNGAARNIIMNLQPDLYICKKRSATTLTGARWVDSIRGATNHLDSSNSANAQATNADTVTAFNLDGVSLGADATTSAFNTGTHTYVDYGLKKLEGFFDVVQHVGDGTASKTIDHALNALPEAIITRPYSAAGGWPVYLRYSSAAPHLAHKLLNSTAVAVASTAWANTQPTATSFYVGSNTLTNASGVSYVSYLFASKAGVCKVGKYEGGSSATQTVSCGFSPRILIINRVDNAGDFYIYDTARGINSGTNDPRLSLNTTAAEVSTDNSVEPSAGGFVVSQNATTNLNVQANGDNTVAATSNFGTSVIYTSIYANGVHIIAGDAGKLAVSTDGETFALKDSKFGTTSIRGIAYDGAGRFVIVGLTGKVAYSTDNGETWTLGNSGVTTNLFGVAYVSGRFVAIGTGVRYSSDGGVSWTAVSYPDTIAYFLTSADGVLLAGGYNTGKYTVSLDGGLTWSVKTITGATGTIDGAGKIGANYVFGGTDYKIYTTTDFVTHTQRATTTDRVVKFSSINGVEGFGAGYSGELRHTTDGGVTWTKRAIPTGFGSIVCLHNNGEKYWLAGSSGLIRRISGGVYCYIAIA